MSATRTRSAIRLTAVMMATVILVYAGFLSYLRLNERAFIFLPGDRAVAAPPGALALNEERVSYPSTNGVTVSAWIVPAPPSRPSEQWMLICHGNFGNIGFGARPQFYASMRDVGLNLLAFDYRGYGDSTGAPDEQGLYDDALASYSYLTERRGVAPDEVVIFGHSLGTGVAIELAARVPAAALIVDAAYTSIVDRAAELYPLFPVRYVATQRFASLERVGSIATPKLFLHSPEDTVIPFGHGRRLFEAAPEPKRFVSVRGGHDNAFRVDKDVYFGAIADMVRSVRP
jgi:fermentation-respiration switch protein FrsA (DUF1100 family)